jgi:hypothetical protein
MPNAKVPGCIAAGLIAMTEDSHLKGFTVLHLAWIMDVWHGAQVSESWDF